MNANWRVSFASHSFARLYSPVRHATLPRNVQAEERKAPPQADG